MTDTVPPWGPLASLFSPQRPSTTSVDPQTDNLGSAHKHSVHPTPPIMDMSNKIPTAQAGNDSSLEPDTFAVPSDR